MTILSKRIKNVLSPPVSPFLNKKVFLGNSSSSGGGGASLTGQEALSVVVSSTIMDLDVTIDGSYDGTGEIWTNLVTSPNDGGTYDAWLGATSASAEATDATYVSAATRASCYFEYDGSGYHNGQATDWANMPTIRDIAKTSGGSAFWYAFTGRSSWGTTFCLFTNRVNLAGANEGVGIDFVESAGDKLQISHSDGVVGNATTVTSAMGFSADQDVFMLVTWDANYANYKVYVNGATPFETGTLSPNAFTGDPSNPTFTMMARGNGSLDAPASTRAYGMFAGNEYLTDAKVSAILDHIELRHNRTYRV